ncbi:pre-rRNA 2'-O-ribose RNA methyltransferase FTSJ3 [Leptinotarsa decemlineata]|uniref:pre-rRNA 2'-O-ribose RNA methyltransferase FTSJ3 n=1 Tax=Leptinotarsa decemlineata TaxID=7539 RepID=UPI003D303E35
MGQKKKIGKQRKDKYYQLAKETGLRSRAAFKLIQLNRKFEFLQKSQVCIDLCAAPGGWMQVAKQNMPVSSIVVGIDLFPIKPIPGCISLTEDITTEKCRVALSRELKTWKADVVLHDGAPNVGRNWLHDAYQQACLTLSSLKLASQFLRKGGWFITKVFRSKDYHALIWVLKQLFKKVHATKPQASRTESAEIFVVCQYYIAPDKIDPKFMDPKYVFEELEIEPKNKLNVFHPEKKKKVKADGYPENDYTLYTKLKVSDFIKHENGIDILQNASEIVFDDTDILNNEKTTPEIKECVKDIKVLGRKDLRNLLTWRKFFHDEYVKQQTDSEEKNEIDGDPKVKKDDSGDSNDDDNDLKQVDQQITELQEGEYREQKRKKKKVQKERRKLNERLNLKMILKNDDGPTMVGDDMFSLKQVKDSTKMKKIIDQTPDTVAQSDGESDDERKIPKYTKYEKGQGHLDSSGTYYKDSDSELEYETENEDEEIKEGLGLGEEESGDDSPKKRVKINSQKKSKTMEEHPLITDLDYRDKEKKKAHKAELWFDRVAFKNLIDEKDEDADLDRMVENFKKKGGKVIGEEIGDLNKQSRKVSKKDLREESEDSDYNSEEKEGADSDDTGSDSDYDVEKEFHVPVNNTKKDGFEIVKSTGKKRKHKLSSEELALGSVIVNSKKAKRDLVDAAWNRYTFNDENLPDWFVKEEEKHMKREVPVPKELVDEYNKKLEDINVRPIKKVIEAKARKKKRALKKLDRAKKKVEALMDNVDVTDREKAKQIRQLYKKAKQEPKKEVTYVVSKKHMAAKRVQRPSGVKGHYKVVDARMKKDLKAQKKKMKTMGRGRKSKGARKGGSNNSSKGRTPNKKQR